MRRLALVAVIALVAAPSAGRALPSVNVGPLPGPPVLYAPLASAPQLENTGGWKASPLMVSGADAYADGEYLYQDYIYDSYGANTSNVPADSPDTTPAATATLFGPATGDVVYPTDAKKYAFDAADLLEFRARETADGISYRVTLNTLIDPSVAAVAIGVDADHNPATGASDWGYGIGSLGKLGLEHVIVALGDTAKVDGASAPVSVDVERNQIDIQTSLHSAGETWRHYVAVGLANGSGFKAILDQPTAEDPGGAHSTTPPPVFNIGFRFSEPMGSQYLSDPSQIVPATLNFGTRASGYGHWREDGQAHALAARDISAYHADVDFAKLGAGVNESHVPQHGWIDRLYASHLDLGEGAQPTRPMLLGNIQPYGAYIPASYTGKFGVPFHLLMHSLSCSYNQYAVFTPNQLRQLGDDRGAILMTPEGRGPDGWYHDAAEVDTFEAWADLDHHYNIDSNRVTVGGYSMGGYGTLKFAAQYPDLFAKGFAVVPPADEAIQGAPTGGISEDNQNTLRIADNIRNVPLLMWEGTNDELVPSPGTLQYDKRLDDLGYRYQQWLFLGYDHFLESVTDQWAEGRDWLGNARVKRNPEEVVYRAMPEMDNGALDLVHDHAYWVSDIRVATGARSGLIDARADNTAVGKPSPYSTNGAGVRLQPWGGIYVEKGVDWHPVTQAPSNSLTVNLTDVASATLWLVRTNLDRSAPITINVTTNGASTLKLILGDGHVETITVSSTGYSATL